MQMLANHIELLRGLSMNVRSRTVQDRGRRRVIRKGIKKPAIGSCRRDEPVADGHGVSRRDAALSRRQWAWRTGQSVVLTIAPWLASPRSLQSAALAGDLVCENPSRSCLELTATGFR